MNKSVILLFVAFQQISERMNAAHEKNTKKRNLYLHFVFVEKKKNKWKGKAFLREISKLNNYFEDSSGQR